MLGRAFAATAILLMASLAGCISRGGESEPVETESLNQTPTGFADENDTRAPDGRGELAAFKETNRTEASGTGAMDHKHDYWNGQTRKLVTHIESGLIPFPLLPCKKQGGGCTAGQAQPGTDTYPAGTSIADYDIDKPGLVYEGTAQLELVLNYVYGPNFCVRGTCTPSVDHPAVTVFFDYITAADEPGAWRTGGQLKVGEPFLIPVKPHEADMPHQTKSLWLFRIYTGEPTWFEWNITFTAVKGGEVVDWPPHPDLYAERSERLIFEGPVHMESKGTLDSNIFGSDAGWLNPERIISWGTDRVEIEVSGVNLQTEGGIVPAQGFVLEYHNASKPPLLGHGAQYGGRLVDEGSDGSTWHFTIDISGDYDSYDTPYGDKSRWGFRFVPQFDNGGAACVDDAFLQQILVGCQLVPWKMDYTMKIKAYGRPHTGEEIPDPNAA